MNELDRIAQQKMTVKEVSTILGVTPEAIKKHVRNLFPNTIRNGVAITLNELQVSEIKRHMIPTTEVVGATTDIEMVEKTMQVMSWLKSKYDESQKTIERQTMQIEEMKPAVQFMADVIGSKDAIEMSKVAKIIDCGMGRNKLFEFLRDNGVLRSNNEPMQRYIDLKWFRVVEQKYESTPGEFRINIKTLVYQKGIDGIIKLVRSK